MILLLLLLLLLIMIIIIISIQSYYIFLYVFLSLSLYIYIYIAIYSYVLCWGNQTRIVVARCRYPAIVKAHFNGGMHECTWIVKCSYQH